MNTEKTYIHVRHPNGEVTEYKGDTVIVLSADQKNGRIEVDGLCAGARISKRMVKALLESSMSHTLKVYKEGGEGLPEFLEDAQEVMNKVIHKYMKEKTETKDPSQDDLEELLNMLSLIIRNRK